MPFGIAAAGVAAAGSIAGAAISSSGASSAAKTQANASNAALAQQAAQQGYTNANLQPYVNAGLNGISRQQDLIDNYNSTLQPYLNNLTTLGNSATAQQALAQTPGYQFTLQQGLQSTQNAAAARGLGVSGAALKGAASYATGLADNTYQQQYQNASNNLTQASNVYNGLYNLNQNAINVGENAGAQLGNTGQSAATNSGSILTGQGNAQASSQIAGSNALTSGITNVSNALTGAANNPYVQQSLNQSQYGGTSNAGLLFSGGSTIDDSAAGGIGGAFSG